MLPSEGSQLTVELELIWSFIFQAPVSSWPDNAKYGLHNPQDKVVLNLKASWLKPSLPVLLKRIIQIPNKALPYPSRGQLSH